MSSKTVWSSKLVQDHHTHTHTHTVSVRGKNKKLVTQTAIKLSVLEVNLIVLN